MFSALGTSRYFKESLFGVRGGAISSSESFLLTKLCWISLIECIIVAFAGKKPKAGKKSKKDVAPKKVEHAEQPIPTNPVPVEAVSKEEVPCADLSPVKSNAVISMQTLATGRTCTIWGPGNRHSAQGECPQRATCRRQH